MQVAHVDDYDTHAVIGGKNVMEFKIAQTAEFFTVLSSTLYSNKPLAVSREVLCNAWDSHIVSDIKDKPIKIILTKDNLSIRDYGAGIHPDNMQDIYCVYGNSTKKNDGNQTGGFGLGSKSPFAYSDHFSVTTYHDGLKTVYAISRGSQLTQGKPDLRIMVQVPTTESGLEINIPIKSIEDRNTFTRYIKDIASLGEMNVNLNSIIIPIIPISKATNNLFITKEELPHNKYEIHIRYGNVVYPVDTHEEYEDLYNYIHNSLNAFPGPRYNRDDWKIIIQAEPNTISITPSRESLSMTETTINTIKDLLTKVDAEFDINSEHFVNLLSKNIDRSTNIYWNIGMPNKLLTDFYNENDNTYIVPNYLSSIEEVAAYFAARSSSLPSGYRRKELNNRLNSLISNNYRRKHDLYKFKGIYNNVYKTYRNGYSSDKIIGSEFRKQIIRPIIKSIVKNPLINIKNMYVTGGTSWHRKTNLNVGFWNITEYCPRNKEECLSLLQGVIVLTTGKMRYSDEYNNKIFGDQKGHYVYITPRKLDHRKAVIAHFTKLGFHVIDDVVDLEPVVREPRSKTTVVAKLIGIKTLESLMYHNSFVRNNHNNNNRVVHNTIIKPEFVFKPYQLSGVEYSQKFFSFGDTVGEQIVKLFGSKGGIVVNALQYDKYIREGAKDGYEYIVDNIVNEIKTNPRIQNYFEQNKVESDSTVNLLDFMEIAKHSYIIRDKYKVKSNLTLNKQDQMYIDIYEHLKNSVRNYATISWQIKIRSLADFEKNIVVSKETQNLINLFSNRSSEKLINLINWGSMSRMFSGSLTMQEKVKLEMLIINALSA